MCYMHTASVHGAIHCTRTCTGFLHAVIWRYLLNILAGVSDFGGLGTLMIKSRQIGFIFYAQSVVAAFSGMVYPRLLWGFLPEFGFLFTS